MFLQALTAGSSIVWADALFVRSPTATAAMASATRFKPATSAGLK